MERADDGRLTLNARVADREFLAHPNLWLIASDGERLLERGAAPRRTREAVLALLRSGPVTDAALNLEATGVARPRRHITIQTQDSPAGPILIAVGGAASTRAEPLVLITLALTVALLAAVPVAIILPLAGLLLMAPVFLRGVRPLAAAAVALDGSDLACRLPEADVTPELLPVVRGFNAALARLQTVSERRERLLTDIAHELRTPLAILTLRVEDVPDSPIKQDLQRGAHRLSQMIGQMLDSERLGGPGRRFELVDLVEIARHAAAEIAPLAVSAGYEVEFDAEAETALVRGDPPAIARAVGNLLSNAVAHGGGAGVVRISVARPAVIEVADQGPGVAPEARERVFDAFHRERWDKDGCGLGLHLVSEIMTAHGGRAEVSPGSLRGATFRLVFPESGEFAERL